MTEPRDSYNLGPVPEISRRVRNARVTNIGEAPDSHYEENYDWYVEKRKLDQSIADGSFHQQWEAERKRQELLKIQQADGRERLYGLLIGLWTLLLLGGGSWFTSYVSVQDQDGMMFVLASVVGLTTFLIWLTRFLLKLEYESRS